MRKEFDEFWSLLKVAATAPMPDFAAGVDDSILQSDQRVRRFGYIIVLLVFVGFGGWAIFAPL